MCRIVWLWFRRDMFSVMLPGKCCLSSCLHRSRESWIAPLTWMLRRSCQGLPIGLVTSVIDIAKAALMNQSGASGMPRLSQQSFICVTTSRRPHSQTPAAIHNAGAMNPVTLTAGARKSKN